MRILKDEHFQTVTIKRVVEGHTDPNTGQWVPAGEQLVATCLGDIQPRTGRERANEVQTEYESDYVMYAGVDDITFEPGFSEIIQGDIAEDESGRQYDIVFPGNWQSHYEIDLKAK